MYDSSVETTTPGADVGSRRTAFCCGLLFAAGLLVFGHTVFHDFVDWDDPTHITENPHLNPVTWQSVRQFWAEPYFGLYIPVSYTFFAAEARLARLLASEGTVGGLDPRIFHAGCLLLHLLSTLVVFFILRRLRVGDKAACCGALLFCVHPVQVESVAWVSETRGLLAGLLSLIAILQYLRFSEHTSAPAAESGNSFPNSWRRLCDVRFAAATIAYTLALLAKPTAVAVPLIAAALDRWMLKKPFRQSAAALSGWAALAAVAALVSKTQQTNETLEAVSPLWQRPFIAADALSFYSYKTLWPWQLGFDYGRSPSAVMSSGWVVLTALIPPALLATVWRRRVDASWKAALAVFVAVLIPVLGFIPFAWQSASTVADRYLYLAMLGPALAVALLVARWPGRVSLSVVAVLIAVLAVGSFRQTAVWRDSESLYRHGLRINPSSFIAYNNLGNLRLREGEVPEAIRLFETALKIEPDYSKALYNLGLSFAKTGRDQEAIARFRSALRIEPKNKKALYDLAVVLERQGELAAARDHYHAALAIDPDYAEARNNLGNVLRRLGRTDEAIAQFRQALRVQPDFADALVNLAGVLLVRGRSTKAAELYQKALLADPRRPTVHFNLGLLRLSQGRLAEAEQHFLTAISLDSDNAELYLNLGVVRERRGRQQHAEESYRSGLAIDPEHAPSHLNLGTLLHKQNRLEDALGHLEAAIRLDPNSAIAHNNIGLLQHDRGRYQEAVRHFEAALELDGEFAAAHYNLAKTLHELGETEAALASLRRALGLVTVDSQPYRDVQQLIREYQSEETSQ